MPTTFASRRRVFAAISFSMVPFVVATLTATTAVAQNQPSASAPPPAIAHLFSVVRPAFSGDRALSTVAFVEQRWRWPGNRGFDESIDHVANQLREAGYHRRIEHAASAIRDESQHARSELIIHPERRT